MHKLGNQNYESMIDTIKPPSKLLRMREEMDEQVTTQQKEAYQMAKVLVNSK